MAALVAALIILHVAPANQATTTIMLFVFGAAAFSIIPGLAIRLINAAAEAPNLAATVNIAGFQVANALGSWLGGLIVSSRFGIPALPLFGAFAAALSLLLALAVWRKERAESGVPVPAGAAEPSEVSEANQGGRP